ncbi:chitinase [Photobacterium angustum]|uniref:chitinase n=1 Tax=Photobacterium angustum TaxID=661 RepID=A0A855SBQ3_PHOAN|nr:glycoside hydrolase family 18 protein [Photobacterium angustum]KJF81078.1 chitinase [Photobacterium damselae subsp. damselae]KJG33382.1 chitinase [Photobacterium angustum]KJG41529.1 chitinase [Photobacterium angustum]KJG44558.1 chitinase [Photobacterium angustum]KJG49459.1 chitinase [Photobacterium angustum]
MKAILPLTIAALLSSSAVAANSPVVAGYFADWQYNNEANPYTVKDIPADKLTHVIYAFLSMCGPHQGASDAVQKQIEVACKGKEPFSAVIVDQVSALQKDFGPTKAKVAYKGHFAQLKDLKNEKPELKILPSFGGWTMSEPFHAMAKDKASIEHFSKSAVELIAQYDFFDGIDLDWEYPGGGGLTTSPWNPDTKLSDEQKASEKEAYTHLVKTLRSELDNLEKKTGREYELSTAVGVGSKAESIDWAAVAPHLTNMFAMTYDYLGGWGTQTGHLTNLHATDNGWWGMGTDVFVNKMISLGIPADKLVVGAAFYGRGWEGTKGFDGKAIPKELSSTQGASFGTSAQEPGYFMYWDLKRNYTKAQGYISGYDEKAEAPYLWNEEKQVFISYDDSRSVKAKADWVKKNKLAGLFVWDLSGDENNELMNVMSAELK